MKEYAEKIRKNKTGDKKRILAGYLDAKRESDDLKRRVETMMAKMKELSDEAAQGTEGVNRAIEKGIQNVNNLERMYSRAHGRTMKQLQSIEEAIERVQDPKGRLILRRHYVDGATIGTIAREMNYAVPTVYEIMRGTIRGMALASE